MKLFLKDMNIQSTVTDSTRTSFHLSSQMDDFFMNAVDSTYDSNNLVTHKVYTINGYPCVVAYGSDDSDASSEALSYFLNFYVELYMISKKNNDSTTYTLCLDRIFWVLNTIIVLHPQTSSSNSFKDVIFPPWNYRYSGSTLVCDYLENATDSNMEMLSALCRLAIFDLNDGYLYKNTHAISPLNFTSLGISLDSSNSIFYVLTKFIVMMTYNFMWGGPDETTNNGYGNFSNDNGFQLCFRTSCSSYFYDTGQNIIDNKYGDYVNYSCFIYLSYFFKYILGYQLSELHTKTIYNIIPISGVSGVATTTYFPKWDNVQTSITHFIQNLNNNITSTTISSVLTDGDSPDATFNRLSYQLIQLYILLIQGDKRLGIYNCNTIWSLIVPSISISTIETICINLINVEIHNGGLYLQLKESNNVPDGYYLSPWVSNSNTGITSENASGYYRQLSYMCFKELYLINHSIPSSWTHRTDTSNYYFENHDFGYFGFASNNQLKYSLQQNIIDRYNYTNPIYAKINYFGNNNVENKDWIQHTPTWNNNNTPYFMFSMCTLHQINYNLYKGI
jgi:hypothetical protein